MGDEHIWFEKKTCYNCGKFKYLSQFHGDATSPDGRKKSCKICSTRATHRYYHANKEKYATYAKEWQKQNPLYAIQSENRRRALKLKAEGDATAKQIRDRWEVYGSCCYLCGKPAEATDHVIPLAKGGSNWPSNLRPICRRCNSMKGPKWPYPVTSFQRVLGTRA